MQRMILSVCCLFAGPLSWAANTDHAEHIMNQRYDVERQTTQLQLKWQTESQQLQSQIALYQHEYQALKDKLALKQQQQGQVEAQRAQLLAQQIKAENQSQQYQKLLDGGVDRVTHLWAWLPESLQTHLSIEHAKLMNQQADLAERVLALTEILKQVEQFDQKINLHLGEMLLGDKQWQTEQLYIGLAQAFYRLPDGSEVGIGLPSDEGWQWQARPDLTDTINQAFAVYRQQQSPALIALPIRSQQNQEHQAQQTKAQEETQ